MSIDDSYSFLLCLARKPLNGTVDISFKCSGGECSTFDGSELEPIQLSPDRPEMRMNFTSLIAGHDVIELVIGTKRSDSHQIRLSHISRAYIFAYQFSHLIAATSLRLFAYELVEVGTLNY